MGIFIVNKYNQCLGVAQWSGASLAILEVLGSIPTLERKKKSTDTVIQPEDFPQKL